jgi:hypothetical protein
VTRSIYLRLASLIVACIAYHVSTSQLGRDLEAVAPSRRRRAALAWFATHCTPA